MTTIYKNYPRGLRDKQLIVAIDEYANEINESGADINKVLQFSPYISLGLNELQSRQSKRVTRWSLGISMLSLAIASFALFVSFESSRSSERWEQNQIMLLKQLDKSLEDNRKALTGIVKP